MAAVADDEAAAREASLRHRYLIRFEEDTLRPRPSWIGDVCPWAAAAPASTIAAVPDPRTRRKP